MAYHLMIEEDQPLCGTTNGGGALTYREDVANCVPCWRAYAASLKGQAEALREVNGRLTLERDDALTGRLPPEHRPVPGAPPWTATQTANFWGTKARELEDRLRMVEAADRKHQNETINADRKLHEMEVSYKTLLQHVRADHSNVQCRLCHPALVERDEAVAALVALKGNLRALLGDPDGQ